MTLYWLKTLFWAEEHSGKETDVEALIESHDSPKLCKGSENDVPRFQRTARDSLWTL